MIDSMEIEDIVWKKLDGSSLKSTITGKIRKKERPANSQLEDIVVNCLAVPNRQIQETIVNVNIFVPDIMRPENSVQEKVANDARLKALYAIAEPLLKDVTVNGDTYFEIQQQQVISDRPDSESHYINIQYFYSANIN